MRTIITKHPVLCFISINLLVVIIIAVIFSLEYVPIPLLPGLFAILITAISRGQIGVKCFLRDTRYKKENTGWYLFALFAPFLFCLLSFIIYSFIENTKFITPTFNDPHLYLFEFIFIVIGSYGEEIGWRGFMLPQLQKRHSLLVSSLIIGLVWGIWHLKLMFGVPVFFVYLFLVMELSFVFSWITKKTSNNILAAIILHSSFNASALFFYSNIFMANTPQNNLMLSLYGSMVIILLIPCSFILNIMLHSQKHTL